LLEYSTLNGKHIAINWDEVFKYVLQFKYTSIAKYLIDNDNILNSLDHLYVLTLICDEANKHLLDMVMHKSNFTIHMDAFNNIFYKAVNTQNSYKSQEIDYKFAKYILESYSGLNCFDPSLNDYECIIRMCNEDMICKTIFETLLDNEKFDFNARNGYIFKKLCELDKREFIKLMLNHENYNHIDISKGFIKACTMNNIEVVKTLFRLRKLKISNSTINKAIKKCQHYDDSYEPLIKLLKKNA
jgi:hypothetical protein